MRLVREQHAAGFGQRLDAGGDVDAVAVEGAVLGDQVAGVDAEAEAHPPVLVQVRLPAAGERLLQADIAGDGGLGVVEDRDQAVAGGAGDGAAVLAEQRIEDGGAERAEAPYRPRLVRLHEPAVADDVGG